MKVPLALSLAVLNLLQPHDVIAITSIKGVTSYIDSINHSIDSALHGGGTNTDILSATTQIAPPEKCVNKTNYNYNNDATKTCNWIRASESRRQELCKDAEVAVNCPISCGHCCEDDKKYRFKVRTGMNKGCSWLKTDIGKNHWCEKYQHGEMIWNACPKACGLCEEKLIDNRTQSPSVSAKSPLMSVPSAANKIVTKDGLPRSPSQTDESADKLKKSSNLSGTSPSMSVPSLGSSTGANQRVPKGGLPRTSSPSQISPPKKCVNKADYAYNNDVAKTCEWINANGSRRQELCKDSEVAMNCPISCGICCEDDINYRFQIRVGKTKDCGWLKTTARKFQWCDSYQNKGKIKKFCRKACGLCEENATDIQAQLPSVSAKLSSMRLPSTGSSTGADQRVLKGGLPRPPSPNQASADMRNQSSNVPTKSPAMVVPSTRRSMKKFEEFQEGGVSKGGNPKGGSPKGPTHASVDKRNQYSIVSAKSPSMSVPSTGNPTAVDQRVPKGGLPRSLSQTNNSADKQNQSPSVSDKAPLVGERSLRSSTGANQRVSNDGQSRSSSPTQISPPKKCVNKANYAYNNDAVKTCKWVRADESRRQDLCKDSEVAMSCPISCGICCEDNRKYRFQISTSITRDCNWLKKTERSMKWCEKYQNEQMIMDACPKACGLCEENAFDIQAELPNVSAKSPSMVISSARSLPGADQRVPREGLPLSHSPTQISTPKKCADDKKNRFEVRPGINKGCSWLKTDIGKNHWCEKYRNGEMIWNTCPKACGLCEEKLIDNRTQSPSVSAKSPSMSILSTVSSTSADQRVPKGGLPGSSSSTQVSAPNHTEL